MLNVWSFVTVATGDKYEAQKTCLEELGSISHSFWDDTPEVLPGSCHFLSWLTQPHPHPHLTHP